MKKILCILILLTACSVKIKNFEKYQKAPLLELETMPTKEEINTKLPKVIIISEKSETGEVQAINAQNLIKNNIFKELQSKHYAEIIERFDSNSIQKEIQIAELEGKASNAIASVDYIINIGVPNVTFSHDAKEDILYIATSMAANNIPASRPVIYEYNSVVDGVVKLYEVPSLKIAKVISVKGSHTSREKGTTGSSAQIGIFAIESNTAIASKAKDDNITYKAVQNATRPAINEMKQFFKKKGFISEKRSLKNKVIYSLNRGIEDDFKPQTKVLITRLVERRNSLTDEDEMNEEAICTGIVANRATAKVSWIVFDVACQDKIRLGDKATIVY